MSFAGRAANISGLFIRPREQGTGSDGCAGRTPRSLPIGRYVMETAGHREPCESRGSCTDLGAPGGEIPLGDSTTATSFNPKSRRWPLTRGTPSIPARMRAPATAQFRFAGSSRPVPAAGCRGKGLRLAGGRVTGAREWLSPARHGDSPMDAASAIRKIPLNKLILSPANVRKTPEEMVEEVRAIS